MANIVIISTASTISLTYNDYSVILGRSYSLINKSKAGITNISDVTSGNFIKLNIDDFTISLSQNGEPSTFLVDTVNGVAPLNNSDLLSKLQVIFEPIISIAPAIGGSTLAAQTTGNNSLASIDGKLTNPLPVSGTFFQATQPVSGTFFPATQPVSIAAPTIAKAADLQVSNTGAAAAAVTVTLPAAGGLFHYITHIEIEMYSTAARTGGATPVIVTSTNMIGTPSWNFPSAGAVGTMVNNIYDFTSPIRSSVANTNTTIVAPATTAVIWKIKIWYYTGA